MKTLFLTKKVSKQFATLALLLLCFAATACDSKKTVIPPVDDDTTSPNGTDILMLVVDYTTNKFIGGKEMHFDKISSSFTIETEYKSPGDFGWMKLYYSEIDELIFWGDIIWMGCGEIQYPEEMLAATDFDIAHTEDLVFPKNGFESIFPIDTTWKEIYPESTIESAWNAVKYTTKALEYLNVNAEQKVKVYEYQPSVGVGDIKDRKWVFFVKK